MKKFNAGEFLKKYNLLVLLLVFIVISSVLSPNFLKVNNMLNMMQQCAIPGIIAIGMTIVITLGGIDLSVGGVAAFSGMITSMMVIDGMNIFVSVIAGIALGGALGLVTGALISKCGLPDFITTMAMLQIARGASLLVTKGSPIFGLSETFHMIGGGKVAKTIPVAGLIWIGLTILVFLMMKYTRFGRSLYAIGGNREAAGLSGIKVMRNYTIAYVMCAALAGFAGVLTASYLSTGQPTACNGYELDAIAASVIGGASLAGGISNVIGTFGGVVLLQIITNIFNLVGISSFYQQIAKGAIIIIALLLNKAVSIKKD